MIGVYNWSNAPTPDEQMTAANQPCPWRYTAQSMLDVATPDELGSWIALSGLSIHLHGGYGEWGCETLECLFAELGIQPGDDFEDALKHAREHLSVPGDTVRP